MAKGIDLQLIYCPTTFLISCKKNLAESYNKVFFYIHPAFFETTFLKYFSFVKMTMSQRQ